MADQVNPWQSPETVVKTEENAVQGVLTAVMIRCLKEAAPWLRFAGILGYIAASFLTVAGIVTAIVMMVSGGRGFTGLASVFMVFIYILLGAAAFFPAHFTHSFGVKIRHYLLSGAEKDLEEAFKNNRSLWKFTGILAIVYLALVPIGIAAAAMAAASAVF
jgi:hypothetical protein